MEGNLEALESAALLIDLDDRVLDCNSAAERLFHLRAEGTIGRRFRDLGVSYHTPQLRAALEDVKRGGGRQTIAELAFTRPDAAVVIARVTVAPVADHGRVVAVLATADERTDDVALRVERDQLSIEIESLTARHQAVEQELLTTAEELRTANEELTALNEALQAKITELEAAQASDRQKTQFLAILAHELRNPLASIGTAMHVIHLQTPRRTVVEKARRVVDRQVKHLARLLDDLLDVSRIQRGKIELRKEVVDLAATVREAMEDVRHLVEAGRHRVSVSFPDEPLMVEGDPIRLVQVVVNLLNNAAKYTQPGGQIIVAGYREGAEALVHVTDTGLGIAPDLLPRVFDMFTQADSSLAHSRGGLGIGLTLVRQVIELHGGQVSAHSAGLGRGSEFVIRLPLVEGAGREESPATPGTPAFGRPRRVLVIEDNRDSREMLRIALELEGHHVDTSIDGPQGVEAARAFAPDVVLIDIGLPGLDGYEVARAIRKSLADTVVLIALTGYGDGEAHRRAAEAGFDLHLVKPVDPGQLARIVAESRRPGNEKG